MATSTLLTLLSAGQADDQRAAFILPETESTLTYADLRTVVGSCRDVLRSSLGVKPGDVVASSFVNGLEFVATFFGTGLARAVAAPLNPAYTATEYSFYLGDTRPVVLLLPWSAKGTTHPALAAAEKERTPVAFVRVDDKRVLIESSPPTNRQPPTAPITGDPQPEDVALVLHTSGTTGRPKSVPLSHRNLLASARNIVGTYDLSPQDRTLLVMPLFHVHGLLAGLIAPFHSRGSVVCPARFSAQRFWADFARWKCTWFTAVPTIHAILLNTPVPDPLPKIRFIRSCSSSLPPVIFERLEKTFKAPVLEAYAMTEAAHQMTSNTVKSRIAGTVGVGHGVEVSIRDGQGNEVPRGTRGEVCVRGANVTRGYWANERANAEAFWPGVWFRTGDEGRMLDDGSGHLQLTGRLKELINRAGEKIGPLEVDAAILECPGVAEAVCFGVDDDKYGEVVWAGVVLKDGVVPPPSDRREEHRIREELQGKLAKFKIPERIIFTDKIPKTATGKIQRRHVKEAFVALSKALDRPAKL